MEQWEKIERKIDDLTKATGEMRQDFTEKLGKLKIEQPKS